MKHSNYITSNILFPTEWIDYELIDFGHGKKLERFGDYTFIRPDSQALAKPVLQKEIWYNADGMLVLIFMKKKEIGNSLKKSQNIGQSIMAS